MSGLIRIAHFLKNQLKKLNKKKPLKQKKEKFEPCLVDIKTNAYIPDDWVGSVEQKMIEYKNLLKLKRSMNLKFQLQALKTGSLKFLNL